MTVVRAAVSVIDGLADLGHTPTLIGGLAHAIWVPDARADSTPDIDFVIDPRHLQSHPLFETALEMIGLELATGYEGKWLISVGGHEIKVDILAPKRLTPPAGQHGASLPPHADYVFRREVGSEPALVDWILVDSLQGHALNHQHPVAGPVAVLIGKIFKVTDRVLRGTWNRTLESQQKVRRNTIEMLCYLEREQELGILARLSSLFERLDPNDLTDVAVSEVIVEGFNRLGDHFGNPTDILPSLAATDSSQPGQSDRRREQSVVFLVGDFLSRAQQIGKPPEHSSGL